MTDQRRYKSNEVLNLSSGFEPIIPGLRFRSFIFPGGEPHFCLDDSPNEHVVITTRIKNFEDLGILLTATDALKRCGARNIDLLLTYFPGARQDRVVNAGEALTVRVYADLINNQNYNSVTILDPHSYVVSALIDRVRVLGNYFFVRDCIQKLELKAEQKRFYLVAPDAGARKRVEANLNFIKGVGLLPGVELSIAQCEKERDPKTGKITSYSVPNVFSCVPQTNDCLVIDDICDGGSTFIELAKDLRLKGAERLYLAVTHGIFSKGVDELKKYYSRIFTTNSFPSAYLDQVEVTPIKESDII